MRCIYDTCSVVTNKVRLLSLRSFAVRVRYTKMDNVRPWDHLKSSYIYSKSDDEESWEGSECYCCDNEAIGTCSECGRFRCEMHTHLTLMCDPPMENPYTCLTCDICHNY